MTQEDINPPVQLAIKNLKSEFLNVDQLVFEGDKASFNKVIMLIFANDMLAGIVPSDEVDIDETAITDDEGEDIYKKLFQEIEKSKTQTTASTSPKIRDMSSGISITNETE